ncbi:unnamed protein product [Gordionus sp. m RMFG-2023]
MSFVKIKNLINKANIFDKSYKDIHTNVTHFPQKNESIFPRYLNYLDTLMQLDTIWVFVLLILAYLISWTIFAILWWFLSYANGDFSYLNDPAQRCLMDIRDFYSIFLFSIETQHTIGYGFRYLNDKCRVGVILLMLQCIAGVIVECLTTGILFIKFCYPRKREKCIIFSDRCVVNQRNGVLYLMARIAETNQIHLTNVSITAVLYREKITHEGEVIPFNPYFLNIHTWEGKENCENINLSVPQIILHHINSKSPLYDLAINEDYIIDENFQILFMVSGYAKPTGIPIQIYKSYYPTDILWGNRFQNMYIKDKDKKICVDFMKFNETIVKDVGLQAWRQNIDKDELSFTDSSLAEKLSDIMKEHNAIIMRMN